jgi:diguanylate cyclase (GGDEF)-like protein
MRIRVLGRQDPLLFTGLAFALLVVFQESIQHVLDAAGEVERTYGVALRPALLILLVMFVFHQYAKRREMKAEAAAAASDSIQARARAEELEQLMVFGQALSRALTTDGLREAVWRHLPTLAGGADTWVVLRHEYGWERMTDIGCVRWPAGTIEQAADVVADSPLPAQQQPGGIEHAAHVCFAMLIGDRVAGVLGLPTPLPGRTIRPTVAAAAALLAIAVRNAQLFADVRDHSVKDALTGCYNRAYALEFLDGELARSRRSGNPVSLVLFDVDDFKRINDRCGHLCGDNVLAAVGQRLRQVLRRSDIRCRYGGDEFLLVLPDTGESGAARVAEWVRGEIEQIAAGPTGERLSVTISAGTATIHKDDQQAADIIERADKALYQAKAHGRNCVRPGAVRAPALETITLAPGPMTTH